MLKHFMTSWTSNILNIDFLENEKSFWSEIKIIFLVSQKLSDRLKKNKLVKM